MLQPGDDFKLRSHSHLPKPISSKVRPQILYFDPVEFASGRDSNVSTVEFQLDKLLFVRNVR